MTQPPPILELCSVSVSYGHIVAVSKASLRIAKGSIVALLGANGAGKSSLLAAIMGITASSGAVFFNGVDQSKRTIDRRAHDGMSLVPEKRELFTTMSVEDNLRLGRFRLRGGAGMTDKLDELWALFPRLLERRKQLAGTLSGGERQMLAIARALMAEPSFLMLDEPSLGLAPLIVNEVLSAMAQLQKRGVTLLLVEQNARAALRIAESGYVLEGGRICLAGPADILKNDPRVVASYLGAQSPS